MTRVHLGFHNINKIVLTMLFALILAMPKSASAQVYNNPHSGGQSPAKAYALYAKAQEAFKMGDFNACINILEAAKVFDHANKNFLHLQALAYAEAGDNYNAMMQFRAALSLDYNFLEARNNYGTFMQKTGEVKQAKKEFTECIRINPNYAEPHYHLGTILKQQGDLDAAIEEFRTAVNLKQNYFEAQRDLGIAIYEKYEKGELKEISESLEKLQAAARLIPRNPMVHYYLGTIWCSEGNLDEAEKEFRIALMNDPHFAAGHYELGKLRYLRGDPNRCLREMEASLKVSPTYTESKAFPNVDRTKIKTYRSYCFEAKGFFNSALKEWMEVMETSRNKTEIAAHMKELIKIRDRKAKKKKGDFSYDEDTYQALISEGIEAVDNGSFQNAKASFNRALEINPGGWEAYQNLGGILELEGDLTAAIAKYTKAIELCPNFAGLYYNMGYVLEKSRLPVEAGREYKKFHNLEGQYPYDPKHIVRLQLQDVQRQQRERSGY